MDNKKYIDKVIDHMVRDTEIDYENRRVIFSRFSYHFSFSLSPTFLPFSKFVSYPILPSSPFYKYCRNQFGLTPKEIKYVWDKYKDIMLEKIHQ